MNSEPLSRGEELIVAAFSTARRSGRENWREMATPVLKNRTLSLTSRAFSDRDWGAATFREVLSFYPSLVRVDITTRPPTACLIRGPAEDTSGTTPTSPNAQNQMMPINGCDRTSGDPYWTTRAATSTSEPEKPRFLLIQFIRPVRPTCVSVSPFAP